MLVFSPIVYSSAMSVEHGLPADWLFWRGFDIRMLSRCEELWVLMLEGWRESKGVSEEIEIAKQYGMRVDYITEKWGLDGYA